MTELKLVKKAKLIGNNQLIEIWHYDTMIFSYNSESRKAIAKIDLSQTSNRQIKYALAFFDVKAENLTEIKPAEKWIYSTPIFS